MRYMGRFAAVAVMMSDVAIDAIAMLCFTDVLVVFDTSAVCGNVCPTTVDLSAPALGDSMNLESTGCVATAVGVALVGENSPNESVACVDGATVVVEDMSAVVTSDTMKL